MCKPGSSSWKNDAACTGPLRRQRAPWPQQPQGDDAPILRRGQFSCEKRDPCERAARNPDDARSARACAGSAWRGPPDGWTGRSLVVRHELEARRKVLGIRGKLLFEPDHVALLQLTMSRRASAYHGLNMGAWDGRILKQGCKDGQRRQHRDRTLIAQCLTPYAEEIALLSVLGSDSAVARLAECSGLLVDGFPLSFPFRAASRSVAASRIPASRAISGNSPTCRHPGARGQRLGHGAPGSPECAQSRKRHPSAIARDVAETVSVALHPQLQLSQPGRVDDRSTAGQGVSSRRTVVCRPRSSHLRPPRSRNAPRPEPVGNC